jgi:hypothetical protein
MQFSEGFVGSAEALDVRETETANLPEIFGRTLNGSIIAFQTKLIVFVQKRAL